VYLKDLKIDHKTLNIEDLFNNNDGSECNENIFDSFDNFDYDENNVHINDVYIDDMNIWQCDACTFLNYESTLYCLMCQNSNPLNDRTNDEYINFIEDNEYVYDEFDFEFDDNVQDILLERENDGADNSSYCNDNREHNKNINCVTINGCFGYVKMKRKVSRKKKMKKVKIQKDGFQDSVNEMFDSYPLLKDKLIYASRNLNNTVINSSFKLNLIARPKWIQDFCGGMNQLQPKIVYHGTDSKNDNGISTNSLLIGGTRGVKVAHGTAHGRGIYCSPDLSTAAGYARGSIYVCLVHSADEYNNIWVARKETNILPCILISYGGDFHHNSPQRRTVKIVPILKVIDLKNIHRKLRKKIVFKK